MSDLKYSLPGMTDWKFAAPTLQHKGGAGYTITTATSAQEVAEAVKRLLRGTTFTPDEAAFETVAQAAMKIDWQTMLNPYPVFVAPLLNAATVVTAATAGQKVLTQEQIKTMGEHLKSVYFELFPQA